MMSTQAESVQVVQKEAERLKQYLAALPEEAWSMASACALWAVRDVAAHLLTAASLYTEWIARGLRGDTSTPEGRLEPHIFNAASHPPQPLLDKEAPMRDNPLCLPSLAFAVLLPLAIIGCGVHLHSPANQKVAEQAQTEFQDAKIGETMNEERGRLSELLKQELTAVRRLTLAHRDAAVVKVIGGSDAANSWDAWKTDIHQRFAVLLGSPPAVPEEHYGAIVGELAGAQFAFTSARDALAR